MNIVKLSNHIQQNGYSITKFDELSYCHCKQCVIVYSVFKYLSRVVYETESMFGI